MNPSICGCNFIIIKGDPFFFFFGIPSITTDLLSTAQYIKNLVFSHNSSSIITLGSSFGSYLALLFGYLLQANEIYMFAPICSIDNTFINNPQYETLPETINNIIHIKSDANKNLLKFLDLSNFHFNSSIFIHYANKFQPDITNLNLIKKNNDVTEIPYDTDKHGQPIKIFNNSGLLRKLFFNISHKNFINNFNFINENGIF